MHVCACMWVFVCVRCVCVRVHAIVDSRLAVKQRDEGSRLRLQLLAAAECATTCCSMVAFVD